jgi:hypothetical protein
MGSRHRLMLVAGVSGLAALSIVTVGQSQTRPRPAAPAATPVQKVTPPIAVYWMSAQTQTGFGMPSMGGGGGGGPDIGAMMRGMMGGGGAVKSLMLQLGSSQTNPAPQADHLPPPVLGAGPSLPLWTPERVPPEPREPNQIPENFEKPRGKMLIFWGCGERAKPGQPVVIDFAQMAEGRMPAGLSALRGLDVRNMNPPSTSRNRTYGEWPNTRSRATVPSSGSMVGAHTIRGNYSPQIDFTLEEDQDFLGPLNLTTNAKAPGGWTNLGWNLVGNAQAYFASAIGGGGQDETVVMWTSSDAPAAAFVSPDYMTPSDITRLVASKALMGPATKTCMVPKEVTDAAPQAMVSLIAYGGEANFIHPPRPADPRVTWNQQWAVKVRYRSATGGLLGQDMAAMMGGGGREGRRGQAQPPQQPGQPARPPRAPSAADILRGGILGGIPFPR